MFEFDNTFARDLEGLYVDWKPETFPRPELVILNDELAQQLRLDPAELSKSAAAAFAGAALPEGATPLAQAYAGHQFGGFAPQLGDGRAIWLGEIVDRDGDRRALQLKGSGRTPFSRGGDGRATLGPVLREYLVSEAMHRLGVPTTRALAAVTTGEDVVRTQPLPGAVLARVAASYLRVGTFEFFAARGELDKLRRLTAYALSRHYPDDGTVGDDAPAALLSRVAVAQGQLIARWMLIGFIHGVMNTDNTTISGETIDYGPCAFMDEFDPATVYSSIDRHGRYAYGNQPSIGAWNLTRLGAALGPILPGEHADKLEVVEAAVNAFADTYKQAWLAGMRDKLGLVSERDGDEDLIEALLAVLGEDKRDYTSSFRDLSTGLRGDRPRASREPATLGFGGWVAKWRERVAAEGRSERATADAMDAVNPLYIARNHLVEGALDEAIGGDLAAFRELHAVLGDPYREQPGKEHYARKAPDGFGPYVTFCGT